jgi:hypothetical protein
VTVHVYVGPTLPSQQVLEIIPQAHVHAPLSGGHLQREWLRAGDQLLVIDGGESCPDEEIRAAAHRGVEIVGTASLGAVWAATCPAMSGAGQIFEFYRSELLAGADEVAVAHEGAPGYRKLSVALVNIRHALRVARQAGFLGTRSTVALLSHARALPYPRRTWEAIADSARRTEPSLLSVLALTLDYVKSNPAAADLMATDARRALTCLASRVSSDERARRPIRAPRWPSAAAS